MGLTMSKGVGKREGRQPGVLALVVTAGGLVLAPLACGKPAPTVEAGALLVRVTVPPGGAKPEQLHLWTYDEGGLIFGDVRIPASGSLPAAQSDGTLGTVLVQPGTIRGALRLHVRAIAGGVRVLDGMASATAAQLRSGNLALSLSVEVPEDADGDDVPDSIDDCVGQANPAQGGCAPEGDAGPGATGGAGGESPATGGAGANGSAGRAGTGGSGSGGNAGGAGGARTGGAGTGAATGGWNWNLGGAAGGWTWNTGGARTGGMGTGGMGTGGARTGGMGTGGGRTGGMGTGGAPKALGVTCGTMPECASGFCVDGVCCESSCTTECRNCATGRCLEVRRADDAPQCMGNMTCNNSAKCVGD